MRGNTQSRLRVLIVDDNFDTATSLSILFEVWGHDVTVAHDGASALSTAIDFRPDAVILDIGLPIMDGFEVAKRLRSIPDFRHTCIVASSGYNRETDLNRALEVGIDRYLVKPFDPFLLETLLESCRSAPRAIPA